MAPPILPRELHDEYVTPLGERIVQKLNIELRENLGLYTAILGFATLSMESDESGSSP